MVVETHHNSLRCSNVEISADEISEFHGERRVVTVPRKQIRHIKLSCDTSVRNPFLEFFVGFTLTFLGMMGIIIFFITAAAGGRLFIQRESGHLALPLIPVILWGATGIGLWLLVRVFRSRYHLIVETSKRERKIFFEKTADIQDIKQFVQKAKIDFGYEIDVSPIDAKGLPD